LTGSLVGYILVRYSDYDVLSMNRDVRVVMLGNVMTTYLENKDAY